MTEYSQQVRWFKAYLEKVAEVKRPLHTMEKTELSRRDDYSASCDDLVKIHEALFLFREKSIMSANLDTTILVMLADELLGYTLEGI